MGILATHAPDIWISLIMNEYCTKCLTLHLGETVRRDDEKEGKLADFPPEGAEFL